MKVQVFNDPIAAEKLIYLLSLTRCVYNANGSNSSTMDFYITIKIRHFIPAELFADFVYIFSHLIEPKHFIEMDKNDVEPAKKRESFT